MGKFFFAIAGRFHLLWYFQKEAIAILSQTTSLAPTGSCKGAWFRLGMLRSMEGDESEAINLFQQAVRADPNDR